MEFRAEFFPVTVERDEQNHCYVFSQTTHPEYEQERGLIERALEDIHQWCPKPTKENPEPEAGYRKFPSAYLPVTIEWNERGREYKLIPVKYPGLWHNNPTTLEDGFRFLENMLDHALWVNAGDAAAYQAEWRKNLPLDVVADDEDFVRIVRPEDYTGDRSTWKKT